MHIFKFDHNIFKRMNCHVLCTLSLLFGLTIFQSLAHASSDKLTTQKQNRTVGFINSSVFPIQLLSKDFPYVITVMPFSFETAQLRQDKNYHFSASYDLSSSYNDCEWGYINPQLLSEGTFLLSRRLKHLSKRPGITPELLEAVKEFYDHNADPKVLGYWNSLSFSRTAVSGAGILSQAIVSTGLIVGANILTGGTVGMGATAAWLYTGGCWAASSGASALIGMESNKQCEKIDLARFKKGMKSMIKETEFDLHAEQRPVLIDLSGSLSIRTGELVHFIYEN